MSNAIFFYRSGDNYGIICVHSCSGDVGLNIESPKLRAPQTMAAETPTRHTYAWIHKFFMSQLLR